MLIYAVDDEESSRYFVEVSITECFKNDEYKIFDNPQQLLDEFMLRQADVVILDIEMPVMTGLELAKKLCEIKERLNIIFLTGYSEYALDALDVFASAYLLKPCSEERIIEAFSKLRYPIEDTKDIFIKTFGNFEVFYKNEPIIFTSLKSKELLAYLVDREGVTVSRNEIGAILFEDDYTRTKQAQLSQIAKKLETTLEENGIKNLFISDKGYRINLSICDCDLVEHLKGNKKYKYSGEYLEQYYWAEFRKSML